MPSSESIHEAGHAIVAIEFNIPFDSIFIGTQRLGDGLARRIGRFKFKDNRWILSYPIIHILASFIAGQLAQGRGENLERIMEIQTAATVDYEGMVQICKLRGVVRDITDLKEFDAILLQAYNLTVKILTRRWKDVMLIAQILDEKRALTRSAIVSILSGKEIASL